MKNPFERKKPFRSVKEARNYMDIELTDEKFKEYLKTVEMPEVNSIDPKVNHNRIMSVLKLIPIKNQRHKLFHALLVTKSAVRAQNAIRGVEVEPDLITKFLADWLTKETGKHVGVNEVRDIEVDAIEYVKSYLDRKVLSKGLTNVKR